MRCRFASLSACLLLCLSSGACGDDEEGGSTTSASSSGGSTSGTSTSSGSTTSTTDDSSTTSTSTSTTDPSTSSGPGTTTDATTDGGSSTGEPLDCDEYAMGGWNACRDGDGELDVSLCGWIPGKTTGTANCLTTAENAMASVCMIEGCVDACDCFEEPATGNATVICAALDSSGTTACALGCAGGQTCPNGMDCLGGVCFHVP